MFLCGTCCPAKGKGSEVDSHLLCDSFRWEGPQPLGRKAEQPLQPRLRPRSTLCWSTSPFRHPPPLTHSSTSHNTLCSFHHCTCHIACLRVSRLRIIIMTAQMSRRIPLPSACLLEEGSPRRGDRLSLGPHQQEGTTTPRQSRYTDTPPSSLPTHLPEFTSRGFHLLHQAHIQRQKHSRSDFSLGSPKPLV